MDVGSLAIAFVGLVLIVGGLLFMYRGNSPRAPAEGAGEEEPEQQQQRRRPVRRRDAPRRRLGDFEDEEDIDFSSLGKKERARLEKKREKAERKVAARAAVEAREEMKRKKEEAYRLRQEEEDVARQEEEAKLEFLRAERERKEQEEYDEWKGLIDVEGEGLAAEEDKVRDAQLSDAFVEHIEANKVVVLEELSTKFEVLPRDVISRISRLEEEGRLSGVLDDRGKYLLITDDEMAAVRRLISEKGRISQAELAARSNELIKM